MKNIKDLTANDYILITSEEESLAIRTLAHEAGLKWNSGRPFTEVSEWETSRDFFLNPVEGRIHVKRDMANQGLPSGAAVWVAADFLPLIHPFKINGRAIQQLKEVGKEINRALDKLREIAIAETTGKVFETKPSIFAPEGDTLCLYRTHVDNSPERAICIGVECTGTNIVKYTLVREENALAYMAGGCVDKYYVTNPLYMKPLSIERPIK